MTAPPASVDYVPLTLQDGTPPHVELVVRQALEKYLAEVRWLLCTKRPGPLNKDQFQRSIAANLLSVVAGASATLYATPGTPGDLFVGVLVNWFPWSRCPPPEPVNEMGAASILYDVIRTSLAHTAGLAAKGKRIVKIASVLKSAQGVFNLERRDAPHRPLMKRKEDTLVLQVDTFYWGIRRMIEALANDPAQRAAAEAWIASGAFANPEGALGRGKAKVVPLPKTKGAEG